MAISGRKPTPTVVKLVTGRRGRLGVNPAEPRPTGKPRPPVRLSGRPKVLWSRFIAKAWWLTEADSPKAWLWVHLQTEAEENLTEMNAARIAQLRALGSELGFDPASRARLAVGSPPAADPVARKFWPEDAS